MARVFLLLVICTLITGYKLRIPENDPGSAWGDAPYPIDEEIKNDPGSAMNDALSVDMDFPFDEENDPGSA